MKLDDIWGHLMLIPRAPTISSGAPQPPSPKRRVGQEPVVARIWEWLRPRQSRLRCTRWTPSCHGAQTSLFKGVDPLHLGEDEPRAVQTLGSADFHPQVEGISFTTPGRVCLRLETRWWSVSP